MSDVLTLSQVRMPGTARSKDDAIVEEVQHTNATEGSGAPPS